MNRLFTNENSLSKQNWPVILNLDAILENKRDLPLNSPGMPNVLIKFRNLEGETPATRHRHGKK